MPEHKLVPGIDFIKGINELGLIMGYHIQTEHPVDNKKIKSPEVDVAWFKEENQKFPLFIFEVESSATNGMAYNPMKVFSKKNEKFEKPLFFFQVILKSVQDSSRIKDLKRTYGTYNYRIYKILNAESQNFLFDILEQHRRISHNLDIVNLFDFLIQSKWIDVDLVSLSVHIENLEFEKKSGLLLSSYVLLASKYKEITPIVFNSLRKIHQDFFSNLNKVNYSTYMGNSWCFPIHLGIINAYSDDLYLKEKAIKQLKYWQANNSHLTMIGPHFGLAQDYDDFLIWGAGGLFGILSLLFRENYDFRIYFAKELKKIIDKTRLNYRICNLLWMLHIIPPIKQSENLFKYIKNSLSEIGGFSMASLGNPPFLNNDIEFIERFLKQKDKFPDFIEFISLNESKKKPDNIERVQIACYLLTNNYFDDELNRKIISMI